LLNKKLIATISDMTGLTEKKTRELVEKTFKAIVASLEEERRVDVRGLGVFEVRLRAGHKARNPRSGESVQVPDNLIVKFNTSATLARKFTALAKKEYADE
jgi:nucleoid DNA-binding protein